MQTHPLQRRVDAFDLPLDRLAHNPNVAEPDKLRAAARAFEAVLLRQILEDAQKPLLPSALSPETSAKAIYRDLVTTQLADGIARSGQFGLAQTLESAWHHQAASPAPGAVGPPASPSVRCGAGVPPASSPHLSLSSSSVTPVTQEIPG